MGVIERTVPYGEFAGSEFATRSLLNLVLDGNPPFDDSYSVIFDGRREFQVYQNPLNLLVTAKKPTEDFARGYVDAYLAGHKLQVAVHESNYHTAKVFPDGQTSFDYTIPGSNIPKNGEVASQTLKKRGQVLKTISYWSALAKRLGFEVQPVQELAMAKDCKAVKLCTNFRKMEPREVQPYIMNTLLAQRENPKSKLAITASTSSLVVDQEGLHLSVSDRMNLRAEVSFVDDLIGEVNAEPSVKYWTQGLTLREQIGNLYRPYKKMLEYSFYFGVGPAVAGLLGYSMRPSVDFSLTAAGATVVAEGLAVGSVLGYKAWNKRKQRKEEELNKARKTFIGFAENQAHLKKPYGKCVILSTNECVLKASRQKQ